MSVIENIVSYIDSNPKQCGIKFSYNIDVINLKNKIKKINITDENIDNNNLYFDILRECIYRKNINFNPIFKKSQWYSIFTEHFFKKCIYCNEKLHSVNWACCDIFCRNCTTKYECKSVLEYFNFNKKQTNIHLGQICGVYEFLENDRNVLVVHFLDGYYILPISVLKHSQVKYIIYDKKQKYNFRNFKNYYSLKNFIEKNNFVDFQISKNYTLEIIFDTNILIKKNFNYDVNMNIDINTISSEIEEINKVYPCLIPNGNITWLLNNFTI